MTLADLEVNEPTGINSHRSATSIRMYPSGTMIDVRAPELSKIHLHDIAHHLSHLCRFTGGVSRFYSVAEHSCRVQALLAAEYQPPMLLFAALLHDASEAYLADISRPLKHAPEMAGYHALENNMQAAIRQRFGIRIDALGRAAIKKVDLEMCAEEARRLGPFSLPDSRLTMGMPPEQAHNWFLTRAENLAERAGVSGVLYAYSDMEVPPLGPSTTDPR